jgi:hypothetical protein
MLDHTLTFEAAEMKKTLWKMAVNHICEDITTPHPKRVRGRLTGFIFKYNFT